jgi:hypothetical protein
VAQDATAKRERKEKLEDILVVDCDVHVLARGEELALPNLGMETVHHVHADDMAQAFVRSLDSWSVAVGGELPRRLSGRVGPAWLR